MDSINEIWQYIKSTQYNIKAEQVEPPVPLMHVKFTQHTFWFVSTYRCFLGKKMQANFIEWNHTPLLNLYL